MQLVDAQAIAYASWDPGKGRKDTIGVSTWTKEAKILDIRQLTLSELDEFLDELPQGITAFIIEDYVINPHVPHGGSKVETARVIGQLQYWARKNKVDTIFFQRSTILPMAEKHAGVKIPRDHSVSHQISAYLHGYEYLLRKGLIEPRVLEDK